MKHQISCEYCGSRKDSLFCHLHSQHLKKFDQFKTCNTFKKGQIIFHEGNKPMGIFCLQQGKVKIFKTGVEGREQIIRMAKPGDILGYRALIGEESYSATATAIEDSAVCFIDKDTFYSVLRTDKNLPYEMMKFLCKELGTAEEYFTEMAQKSVRERLAEDLIILKEKYGYDKNDKAMLNVTLTREELASFVGTATETLIRLLSELKKENIIDLKGRKILILDEIKLFEIANLNY